MRQVQARAVRQECTEGVEEVGRGGRKEGWERSLPGNRKGQEFPPLSTDCPFGGRGSRWHSLGRVSLVVAKAADGHQFAPPFSAQLSSERPRSHD